MPLSVHGWVSIFSEDFDTPVPVGEVIGSTAYANKITARKTGTRTTPPWGTGIYDNGQLEVRDSCLVSHIGTVTDSRGTIPRTTAILPRIPPSLMQPFGVTHGRFSVCLRIPQNLPGYKIAWLLWPTSTKWPRDGEIDCPEQNLATGNVVHGFMHQQDATEGPDQKSARGTTSMADGEWHVVTINWKPGTWKTPLCQFVVDGVSIGRWTARVPNGPMYWCLQTEPYLSHAKPDPAVQGIIEVDWLVAYKAL